MTELIREFMEGISIEVRWCSQGIPAGSRGFDESFMPFGEEAKEFTPSGIRTQFLAEGKSNARLPSPPPEWW
jgi:hypothetical protein